MLALVQLPGRLVLPLVVAVAVGACAVGSGQLLGATQAAEECWWQRGLGRRRHLLLLLAALRATTGACRTWNCASEM